MAGGDIQFDSDTGYVSARASTERPTIAQRLVRMGLVRSERAAQFLLLAVCGVLLIVAYLWYATSAPKAPPRDNFQPGQSVFVPSA